MGAPPRPPRRRQPPRHWTAAAGAAAAVAAAATSLPASTIPAAYAAAAAPPAPPYTPNPTHAALYDRLCTPDGAPRPAPPGSDGDATRAAAGVVCDTHIPTVDPCVDFVSYACGGWVDRVGAAGTRPPAGANGLLARRSGNGPAAAALLDLLRTVRGKAADAVAYVHACVDDRAEVAGWGWVMADPAGWGAELQRDGALEAAAPYLGPAAQVGESAAGWVKAVVYLGICDVFPVFQWRMLRDLKSKPEDYAAYVEPAFPIMTTGQLEQVGDDGVTTLVRTALTFAAPQLGVKTDNATVAGVAAIVKRLAAIQSESFFMPDVERDRQRVAVTLTGAGDLSNTLLLSSVLRKYGYRIQNRNNQDMDYPVYLTDPKYLTEALPAVGLRADSGNAGDRDVVRAYFVFSLVVKMYLAGVLTRPVWADGVRPSTVLFNRSDSTSNEGLPTAVGTCLFELGFRSVRLHDLLDVAYQEAHKAKHRASVELLFSILGTVLDASNGEWFPRIGAGWLSPKTFENFLMHTKNRKYMVGGVGWQAPQIRILQWLARRNGGRLLNRPADYPNCWLDAARVEHLVEVNLFRNNRRASSRRRPLFSLLGSAYEPGAYFDPSVNLIFVAATTAAEPYVDPALPRAMTMGAVGSVMGHELIHPLMGYSRELDSWGRPFNWTTPGDRRGLARREGCYVDKYSRLTPSVFLPPPPGTPPGATPPPVAPIDGGATMEENVADVEGMRLAWMGLRVDQRRHGGAVVGGGEGGTPQPARRATTRGDGLGGNAPLEAAFTAPQLFFLGRAQMMCGAYDRAQLAAGQGGFFPDPYSTVDHRVRGPLTEMPTFAAAWGCPAGTPYAPAKRCEPMFF